MHHSRELPHAPALICRRAAVSAAHCASRGAAVAAAYGARTAACGQACPRRAQSGRARTWVLLALLGVAIGLFAFGVRDRFGMDRTLRITSDTQCEVIEAPAGPEDLEIDARTGIAIVAATDRRTPGARGGLWTLDLNDPEAVPVRLPHDGPGDFRPHGLSLVRVGDDLHAWVVNHPEEGHTVESFLIDLQSMRAIHRATVRGDALVSPNDVVAVDAERFYATNDFSLPPGPGQTMEALLGLALTDVVHYDGQVLRQVLDGLSFPNGIMLSRDGTELMVAQTSAGTITFLDREPVSGLLEAHLLVDLDTGVDNINVAADDSIWVTGHTHLMDFLAHASDPEARSATEVYRIRRVEGSAELDLVFGDDGTLLSGGSVAAAWRDQLLVGGVFEPRLLRCRLAPEHRVD